MVTGSGAAAGTRGPQRFRFNPTSSNITGTSITTPTPIDTITITSRKLEDLLLGTDLNLVNVVTHVFHGEKRGPFLVVVLGQGNQHDVLLLNLLHATSHLLCVIDCLPAANRCLLLCVVGRLPAADECPLQHIRVTLVVILPYIRVTLVNILLPIRVTLVVIVTLKINVNTTAKGLDLGLEAVRGSHMSVVSLVFRSLPNATSGTSSVD